MDGQLLVRVFTGLDDPMTGNLKARIKERYGYEAVTEKDRDYVKFSVPSSIPPAVMDCMKDYVKGYLDGREDFIYEEM